MMGWLIALLAGTITGILSAFGIGGGSLLLIYLTSFAAIDQHQAQGINLLYFLPAAAAALPAHHKHGLLDKKVILPAILAGLAAAGLAAWLSSSLDTGLLRKLFGLFLLYVGLRELFHKDPDQSEKDDPNCECRGEFRSPRLSLPIICISAAMTSIYPCGKTSLSANCCSWILFFRMRSTLISMAMI